MRVICDRDRSVKQMSKSIYLMSKIFFFISIGISLLESLPLKTNRLSHDKYEMPGLFEGDIAGVKMTKVSKT